MNTIFPITNNVPLYEILSKNPETLQLAKMRSVCKQWKTMVDCISRNLLLSLGVRVELEEATIRIYQITACFNCILRTDSPIPNIEKVREMIPHLSCVTQLKLLDRVFLIKRKKDPTFEKFNIYTYKNFLTEVLKELQVKQLFPAVIPTLKTVLVNQGKDITLAATFNSNDALLYIMNTFKPTPKKKIQDSLLPACISGNYTMIHTLIDIGADPKQNDTGNETYLTAACKGNCYKGVKLLLSRGADPDLRNHLQEKPIAAAARINIKIFNLFFDKVPKNSNEKYGPDDDKTLAHFVAEGNKSEVIWKLLGKEILLDEQNIRGVTPLMIAIREKSIETFHNLLECEASLTKRCNQGLSPLDYAVLRNEEIFIRDLLEKINDTRILYGGLKTAIANRNTKAMNMIAKALGVSTPVKYAAFFGIGALAGGFLVKWFFDAGENAT